MRIKYAYSLSLGLMALLACSCSNNSTSANASVVLEINGNTGCNVIAYLDGANPVTETSNGTFTVFTNVTNGAHAVSIYSPLISGSGVCDYTFNGSAHEITIYNACGGGNFGVTCN